TKDVAIGTMSRFELCAPAIRHLRVSFTCGALRIVPRAPGLDHGDLHAVNWRQRIEHAAPLLATVPPNPELPCRRTEIERRRFQLVDAHRVAEDREVALLLRQSTRQPFPR